MYLNLSSEMNRSKGIIMIMVLWVIAILSIIVLEFSYSMRTEINISKNYKDELQYYTMAQGGIERAILELIYKHDPNIQNFRRTLTKEEVSEDQKEWITDGRPYFIEYKNGSCEIRVTSEAGKLNINRISENSLRKVIGNLGLEGEIRDIIVDSILDWRDSDDFYRLNGAENDYYQSLKEPYRCKNGNLDSIEELLLIRGVTPEIFYGGVKKEGEEGAEQIGLKDIFSIYSMGEQIDVNNASRLVLRYFLGIPEEVAEKIFKVREEKLIENQRDLFLRVPEIVPFFKDIGRFIVYRSNLPYYTIEVKAKNKELRAARGLKVIVKIDKNEKKGYKILQWKDALT